MRSAFSQHPQPAQAESSRHVNWIDRCWDKLCRDCRHPSERTRLWPAVLGAAVIALVCLVVPIPAPDLGVDVSWSAVLNWAHAHGSQFGKELVFTYGPLGYLLAPYS